jgi:hypothetical protein
MANNSFLKLVNNFRYAHVLHGLGFPRNWAFSCAIPQNIRMQTIHPASSAGTGLAALDLGNGIEWLKKLLAFDLFGLEPKCKRRSNSAALGG